MRKEVLSVSILPDLRQEIEELASVQGRSVSSMVCHLASEQIAQYRQDQIVIQAARAAQSQDQSQA